MDLEREVAELMGLINRLIQLCSVRCCSLLKVLFRVDKARSTELPNHAAQSIRHFAGDVRLVHNLE